MQSNGSAVISRLKCVNLTSSSRIFSLVHLNGGTLPQRCVVGIYARLILAVSPIFVLE